MKFTICLFGTGAVLSALLAAVPLSQRDWVTFFYLIGHALICCGMAQRAARGVLRATIEREVRKHV